MPNAIKFSTGSETLALKKGNFYIGTGDVGKGPTSATGYYNGITPPSGGYTIYLNKETGGPSIYTASNDEQLISLTNSIASESFTSATQCLVYYASQTDKVVLNRDYEGIVTDGLVLNLDAGFTPSYPRSGTTWTDMRGSNNGTLTNSPTFNSSDSGSIVIDGVDDYVSLGNITYNRTNFSCFIWFNATSYFSDWRGGIFTKWTSTGVPSASEWSLGFNAFSGPTNFGAIIQKDLTTVGNYLNVTGGQNYSLDTWYNLGLTWNSGILNLYLNGALISSGSTNVTVPNTTNQPVMIASFADGASYSSPMKVSNAIIYNKTLSNLEVLQNYAAMGSRYFPLEVQYLVVAGGGGGNNNRSGGGGAGGLLSGTTNSLSLNTNYTVKVGSGGAFNTQGSNSVFNTSTSIGGGQSGTLHGNGFSGGSGGGSGHMWFPDTPRIGGSGVSGQGFSGGSAYADTPDYYQYGPGGGGAGQVGDNTYTNLNVGGEGGDGLYFSEYLEIGGYPSGWFAGGGGGGISYNSGLIALGGNGGGGRNTVNGVVNTGGGGGGNGVGSGGSASGGSGIVIIRVPVYYSATFSSGVTYSLTKSNGYSYYAVTATSTTSETVSFS